MKLSVIMPVYNEARTIEKVVDEIRSVPLEKEIIIVDDASVDGTRDILRQVGMRYPEIKIVYSQPNRGKGFVIQHGFRFASGDVVLIQDADLEYDPRDYLGILEPYGQGAQVVYGSRFMGACERMSALQLFANKLFNLMTNLIHRAHLTDTCTCYKSFKAEIIKSLPLQSNGFEICHEINAKLLRRRYKIVEVPIRYRARTHKEGKKVNWKVFFTSISAILRYGLSRRDSL